MKLEPYESIYLIPMGFNIFAQFRFKPTKQIESLLNEYNIPYQKSQERFKHKKLINCKQQKPIKYKVGKYIFFFTANIIDKILKYYNVPFEKETKK